MAVIKKPVRKIVKISELKQNQSESTVQLEENIIPQEQTIQESELLKRNNIILQQQTLLDQLADQNLKDQVVYLDPVKDQEVVEQLSELRKYQSADQQEEPKKDVTEEYTKKLEDYQNTINQLTTLLNEPDVIQQLENIQQYQNVITQLEQAKTDYTKIDQLETLLSDTSIAQQLEQIQKYQDIANKISTLKNIQSDIQNTKNTGVKTPFEDNIGDVNINGVSPYAIYYEDYLAQLEIEQSIQPTSDDLKNMSYYDGNKTYANDYSNLDIPDLEQCIDEGTWRDRLFWKFVINEDRYWDLTYILIKFALGPLESFLNWFLHKIKSIKIAGWYPFNWVKYTKFAEQFQYDVAKKYDSMFCGTPTFYKNYTGDKYGLAQFLNDLNL